MDELTIIIPEGLEYRELELTRDAHTGHVTFNWEPIDRICIASDLHPDVLRSADMEVIGTIIHSWYLIHLSRGGQPDPVQEGLRMEVIAADQYGIENVLRAPEMLQ